MKCVKCQADNNLKERKLHGGACSSCRHKFTFDPKLSDSFTDPYFLKALGAISVNNSLYFTPRQFYYFFNARKFATKWGSWGSFLMFLGVVSLILSLVFKSPLLLFLAPVLFFGGLALFISPLQRWLQNKMGKKIKADFNDVHSWLERWMSNNGKLGRLLSAPHQKGVPEKVSQEVSAYSFDRAVICDRDEVAHFLIANNFHFENNCAVLSINGYPNSIFDTVLEMLHRNPQLKVYALHDASPAGVQLVHRLRTTSRWFAESHSVTIYDLGLLPRQVMKRSMFVLREMDSARQAAALPETVRNTLQPDEIKWLAEGKFVELESLAPMTLLKLLRDGIAKSRMPESDDALVILDGGGSYGGDGVSVYSVDSFG